MKVVILGYGNIGRYFTKRFLQHEVAVVQVYNRSPKRVNSVKFTSRLHKLVVDADLYLIAVSDNAIKDIARSIEPYVSDKSIICHTSGSTPSSLLAKYSSNYGSFYPLQSITRQRLKEDMNCPILVNGSNPDTTKKLLGLGRLISEKARVISDDDKTKLHLPAVIVNNFTNHLMTLAYDYCQKEDLPYDLLVPLIKETTDRLEGKRHPSAYQTGPAKRKDDSTLSRHRKQVKAHPELKKVYNLMTQAIMNYYEDN